MAVDTFLTSKLLAALGFTPSQDQTRLFEQMGRFLTGSTPLMLVNGYAGTGKTTAMRALVQVMKELHRSVVLLAPTGRSAKVLSNYTGAVARTIHKTIYRQKTPTAKEQEEGAGLGAFTLTPNKNKSTLYVVDEASLLSNESGGFVFFGSGHLLDDLMAYVFGESVGRLGPANGNQLLLLGDSAQLPPVGLTLSPALDPTQLRGYGELIYVELTQVLRQAEGSGILTNATLLREHITQGIPQLPQWQTQGFKDIHCIKGGELLEALNDCISRYGLEEVVVLCRSNKRANRYNAGIRGRILYRESDLTKGDRVMVVKNCYQFLDEVEELDFIANGDVAEVLRISHFHEQYGFRFAEAVLSFPDYHHVELKVKLLLNTLESESPSLTAQEQEKLYREVAQDYAHIKGHRKRYNAIREDLYLNALQVKFANAITCHKAQGGQWKAVFVDKAFFEDALSVDALRWYYTAFTRAQEQLYLVNF